MMVDEILNRNTKTTSTLQKCLVRVLKDVSPIRTLFMEASTSFTTVANQDEYDATDAGFPADARELYLVFGEEGTTPNKRRWDIEGPLPLADVRIVRFNNPDDRPRYFAWHAQTMIFAPQGTPADLTIKVDYFRDATRDTATGAVLTTASTTQTNGWFDRGEEVLRGRTLAKYYRTRVGWDPASAEAQFQEAAIALRAITREYLETRGTGFQPPRRLSDYDEGRTWPYTEIRR